ncbi:MAG: phosphate ABC transporter permease subunit PstC [Coriobacteriales bacterium]|jgi:phosphate transport system permease protein
MNKLAKKQVERVGKLLTGFCIIIVILVVFSLIIMVAQRGISTFTNDGVDFIGFLTGTVWNPHLLDDMGMPTVGALPMIVGSFSVTLLSCVIVIPFAIGSAVYTVEVNPSFGQRVFRPALELLVGIPSVVFGLVGLTILVPWIRSWAGGTGYGVLAGSLVLAVMVLPTVTSLVIDALEAVPDSYRMSSAALGGTRWQNTWHIVLKAATPGILTAIILGMARAFGEALAVQMVIGNAAAMPDSLFTPAATLTSVLTTSMGNEPFGTVYNDALWSLALILLVMSLVFILIVHLIGRRSAVKHD